MLKVRTWPLKSKKAVYFSLPLISSRSAAIAVICSFMVSGVVGQADARPGLNVI